MHNYAPAGDKNAQPAKSIPKPKALSRPSETRKGVDPGNRQPGPQKRYGM